LPYATGLVVANGNVGIGTASPTEKLQVSGNIKASGTVCDGTGTCIGGGGGGSETQTLQDVTTLGATTNKAVSITNNGSSALAVTGSETVGGNLTVSGNATVNGTINGDISSYNNLPKGAMAGYYGHDNFSGNIIKAPATGYMNCASGWTGVATGADNATGGYYSSCVKN
jgi:hypothetical protein